MLFFLTPPPPPPTHTHSHIISLCQHQSWAPDAGHPPHTHTHTSHHANISQGRLLVQHDYPPPPPPNTHTLSHHANVSHGGLLMQDDCLCGQVTLQCFFQLLSCAVVTVIIHLVPVVRVPADDQPHILLSIQLLFVCLGVTQWTENHLTDVK